MTPEALKNRTKQFSLAMIDLVEKLPITSGGRTIAGQLARSGTSVGANYRAACRSRSDKEFIAKMNIVLEEVDECCFWLEIISEKNWLDVNEALKESNELTAICVSTLKTMNKKLTTQNSKF